MGNNSILHELARAKAAFQLRAIEAVICAPAHGSKHDQNMQETPMTTPDTDQLKDLLAKVTPGVWSEITPSDNLWPPRVFAEGSKFICMVDNSDDTQEQRINDARLIALAPELAAETIALRAQAARDKARIERLEAALRLLAGRSESLVHAHRHGNGMEGWYLTIDGVDRAVTAARAALEDGE